MCDTFFVHLRSLTDLFFLAMRKKKISFELTECVVTELDEQLQRLVAQAKENTKLSYSPYSHYKVGAALLLEDGLVVNGANQENAAYPSGLCAERTALFYANANYPTTAPVALAIACWTGGDFTEQPGSPCGNCRQALLETEVRFGKPIKIILYGKECIHVVESVKDLIPLAFTEKDLIV